MTEILYAWKCMGCDAEGEGYNEADLKIALEAHREDTREVRGTTHYYHLTTGVLLKSVIDALAADTQQG